MSHLARKPLIYSWLGSASAPTPLFSRAFAPTRRSDHKPGKSGGCTLPQRGRGAADGFVQIVVKVCLLLNAQASGEQYVWPEVLREIMKLAKVSFFMQESLMSVWSLSTQDC